MLFSNNNINYTFWKTYNVNTNNVINTNITNTSTHNTSEWNTELDSIISTYFNINEPNLIYDNFTNAYSQCETQINTLYSKLNFANAPLLYSKLKTILQRFILIPIQQVNYNDYYLATDYSGNILNNYNIDNFNYNVTQEIAKYPNLNSMNITLDASNEMNNLTPVNMENIFGVISN
jgi:hypothetical protein